MDSRPPLLRHHHQLRRPAGAVGAGAYHPRHVSPLEHPFLAPFLVIPIAQRYGWRAGFLVPSSLGLLWVVAWWVLYRDPSADAPSPRNRDLLRLKQTWGLMLCRFWVGPVVQFYIYWMPNYFRDVRHLSVASSAYFGSVTFLFGDLGSVGGGLAAGWLIARGMAVPAARRSTLFAGASLCLLSFTVPLLHSVPFAIAAISIVLFGHTFLSANMFATVSDMFPSAAVARGLLHGRADADDRRRDFGDAQQGP